MERFFASFPQVIRQGLFAYRGPRFAGQEQHQQREAIRQIKMGQQSPPFVPGVGAVETLDLRQTRERLGAHDAWERLLTRRITASTSSRTSGCVSYHSSPFEKYSIK